MAIMLTLFGAVLATYVGVLLGATAVPVWSAHHRVLPFHFGMVAFGRTGTEAASERAVIGATVNLASRLERVTRRLGTWLAISDDTVRALSTSRAKLLQGRLQKVRSVRLNGCGLRHLWTERPPVAHAHALPAAA